MLNLSVKPNSQGLYQFCFKDLKKKIKNTLIILFQKSKFYSERSEYSFADSSTDDKR